MRKLADAFAYAIAGLRYAVRTQPTLRIHLVIAVVVGVLVVWLALPVVEAAVVILVVIVVIGTELLNTAVEVVVDLLVADNHHPLAKMAKDIAAGAVLVTASAAAIVGILLLGPPLGIRLGISPLLAVQGARVLVLGVLTAGVVALIRLPRRPTRVSLPGAGRDR